MLNFVSIQALNLTSTVKINKNLNSEKKKKKNFYHLKPLLSNKIDGITLIENEKINSEPEIWEIDFFF